VPRRFVQIPSKTLPLLRSPIRPDKRRRHQRTNRRRNGQAPDQFWAAPPADPDEQCGGDHHKCHFGDDAVVQRRGHLQPGTDPKKHDIAPASSGNDAMQEQQRERKEVEGLELQMQQMREPIWPERPRDPADVPRALGPGHQTDVHMHGQSAGNERRQQQDVVAGHGIAGEPIHRQQRDRLQNHVLRVRERAGRRIEDVGVEDTPGQKGARRIRQNVKVPTQDPEVEVGIPRTDQSAKMRGEPCGERPRESHRRNRVEDRSSKTARPDRLRRRVVLGSGRDVR
jgi:hypothetical protein